MVIETIVAVRNKNAVAYPGAFSRSFPSSYVGLSCRLETLCNDPIKAYDSLVFRGIAEIHKDREISSQVEQI